MTNEPESLSPSSDDREIVVTVTARYPMQRVIDSYADAISPDGGYQGTLNDWIKDHGEGFIQEMTSPSGLVYESAWTIR